MMRRRRVLWAVVLVLTLVASAVNAVQTVRAIWAREAAELETIRLRGDLLLLLERCGGLRGPTLADGACLRGAKCSITLGAAHYGAVKGQAADDPLH